MQSQNRGDGLPTQPKLPRELLVVFASLGLVLTGIVVFLVFSPGQAKLELERKSDYSHIRIRRSGNVRTLHFVRDNGREVTESRVNLDQPEQVMLAYAKGMFASYLYKPAQNRVLIVGLGGGSMVHFIAHHDPECQIDVIEIDPVVVELAAEYFDVKSGKNLDVITVDGFEYLRETEQIYDVIYMDAFLKPSEVTDSTGIPQRLKTLEFFKTIQTKLVPDGLVVFNLNSHRDLENDLETIKTTFAQTAEFDCPGSRNLVVVASKSDQPTDATEQAKLAGRLDQRFKANFSFSDILSNRR